MIKMIPGQQYKLTNKKDSFQIDVMYFTETKTYSNPSNSKAIAEIPGIHDFKIMDFESFTDELKLYLPPTTRESGHIGLTSIDLLNYIVKGI